MIRIPSKRALALTACRLTQAHRWWGRVDRWHGVVVLNYHRIGDPTSSPLDRGVFSTTADGFEEQVRYLKRDCDLITSQDLPDVLSGNGRRRSVLLTFDDGYRDNYELAFPILKVHNASAVFFISTAFIDRGVAAWWDDLAWVVRHASQTQLEFPPWLQAPLDLRDQEAAMRTLLRLIKTLSPIERETVLDQLAHASDSERCPLEVSRATWMTWEMVQEMHASGMEIGAHTINHPVLSYCSNEEQRSEIFGSKARLEEVLKSPVSLFSFPVGSPSSFTDRTRDLIRQAGFQWAFSFYSGISESAADPFDIRRIPIEPRVSMNELRALVHMPRIFAR
ncbi:MAG: hypothetical protein DWH91_02520 [Planctomycetota bacterium]|nr:MAG: hypothetical protein DWH91_02520 [Planctomycetota bacterium]